MLAWSANSLYINSLVNGKPGRLLLDTAATILSWESAASIALKGRGHSVASGPFSAVGSSSRCGARSSHGREDSGRGGVQPARCVSRRAVVTATGNSRSGLSIESFIREIFPLTAKRPHPPADPPGSLRRVSVRSSNFRRGSDLRARDGLKDLVFLLKSRLGKNTEPREIKVDEAFSVIEENRDLGECAQELNLEALSCSSSSISISLPEDLNKDDSSSEEVMAEARGPVINPTKFKGGFDDNVEEYLAHFERKLVIIPCYLEGAALKWYENMEERLGAALTWEQLKAAMKDAL
ncbi:hypothetical protein J6590_099153 [Homalodisca vitripennis]|nr:hypothetical protein J6590_099153 [Homalodisca vitripennis]